MKLTPVIDILRFVSIDGTTIVHITQSRSNLGTYSDPPVVEDIREVWGTCLDDTPDSFREIGQLQDVLRTIAPRQMVTAAATASPRRFAEMIAFAHDLGLVFYVASRAMWLVADHIADAQGFCEIEVQEEVLNFHTILSTHLFREQREAAGIYRVSYSLSDFAIRSRVLVEGDTGSNRTGDGS